MESFNDLQPEPLEPELERFGADAKHRSSRLRRLAIGFALTVATATTMGAAWFAVTAFSAGVAGSCGGG